MNETTELSPSEQLQWYFNQAEQGDVSARRELGRMYYHGFTHPDDPTVEIEPDANVAMELLVEAAEEGDGDAAFLLGQMHDGEACLGPFDDPDEAFRRYQQAVDLDCRPARFFLATRYLIGHGVDRDDRLGREILIEAAYAGDTDAQDFLTAVYEKDGDEERAAAWRIVAGIFGSERNSDIVGQCVPVGTPELARLLIQKVNIYSALVECDAPELIAAADLLREAFYEEI